MSTIPSQCPECHEISIKISDISPDDHNRGNTWRTRAICENCGEYVEWFDNIASEP